MAALVAVIVAIGRDYSLLVALKRAVVSYLIFFFVASLLALIYWAGVLAETRKPQGPQGPSGSKGPDLEDDEP
jgi:hypothetical protein